MNNLKRISGVIVLCLLQVIVFAQTNAVVDDATKRAERMQQSIYIVMAVAITIMVGLFIYVFSLDRKISKLEK